MTSKRILALFICTSAIILNISVSGVYANTSSESRNLESDIEEFVVNNYDPILDSKKFENVEIQQIIIRGNNTIRSNTIEFYVYFPNNKYTYDQANKNVENMMNSGLFEKVSMYMEDDNLIIVVEESRYVHKVKIVGSDDIESDIIKQDLLTKDGSRYSKNMIDLDVERIRNLFIDIGYLNAKVEVSEEVQDNGVLHLTFNIEAGEDVSISKIDFIGNSQIASADLKNVLSISEKNWYNFWQNTSYNIAQINLSKNLLNQYYRNNGFAKVQIDHSVRYDKESESFIISYLIDEGAKFKIGKVNIFTENNEDIKLLLSEDIIHRNSEIFDRRLRKLKEEQDDEDHKNLEQAEEKKKLTKKNKDIKEGGDNKGKTKNKGNEKNNKDNFQTNIQKLRSEILIETGDLYVFDSIQNSLDDVNNFLQNSGYGFIETSISQDIDEERGSVNLNYQISKIQKIYINKIVIRGNNRTYDDVIRQNIHFTEGEMFSRNKINLSRKDLLRLGFFSDVEINSEKSPNYGDRMDIYINVKEQKTGSINLSGGYSSVNGAIFSFGINERNWLGKGQRLGVNFTHSDLYEVYRLSFMEPKIFNSDLNYNIGLSYSESRYTSEAYINKTFRVTTGIGYKINSNWSYNIEYDISSSRITESNDTTVNAGRSAYVESFLNDRFTNSGIAHYISYDSSNNNMNPSSGVRVFFKQKISGIGGNVKMLEHTLNAKNFYGMNLFNQDSVLVSGLNLGHLKGYGDYNITVMDLFYINTNRMIRGLERASVSVKEISNGSQVVLGAKQYYLFTNSLLIPIAPLKNYGIKALFFFDAGSAYGIDNPNNLPNLFQNDTLRMSVGTGLNWNSPAGPISIYYANPFKKADTDIAKEFAIEFSSLF